MNCKSVQDMLFNNSLAIWEVQIKATVRYCYILTKKAKIVTISKADNDAEKLNFIHHCYCKCKANVNAANVKQMLLQM